MSLRAQRGNLNFKTSNLSLRAKRGNLKIIKKIFKILKIRANLTKKIAFLSAIFQFLKNFCENFNKTSLNINKKMKTTILRFFNIKNII